MFSELSLVWLERVAAEEFIFVFTFSMLVWTLDGRNTESTPMRFAESR